MSQDPFKKQSRDDQIIALLNKLGERLIRSEKERIALKASLKRYDRKMEDLEDRSENSERAYLGLQNKLSKIELSRDDLTAWQEQIEERQRVQAEKLKKAEHLTEQIEHAIAHQNRLNRRMEKIVADKARLLEKLETIETAVLRTQAQLGDNTHPPLLDDKSAQKGNEETRSETAETTVATDERDLVKTGVSASRMDRSLYWQAAGVVALIVLAVVSAWGISRVTPEGFLVSESALMAESQPDAVNLADGAQTSLPAVTESPPQDFADAGFANNEAFPGESASATGPKDDAWYQNENSLLERFAEDPDGLAEDLNNIEPAPASVPEDIDEAAAQGKASVRTGDQAAESTATSVAFTREAPAPFDAENFIAAHTPDEYLTDRIKPDPALPDVVRKIEDKAFEDIPEAQHDLAAIYTAGHGGVDVDYQKAALWFREAAANGIANARYNLGVLYHQGLGVEKDINQAVGWYRTAAELDHPEAQYNLGIAHIEGVGASYDPKAAAKYFNQAALGGILEAAYNLGLIYENGLLGQQNPDNALFWYEYAARQGSPDAQTALEQLARVLDMSMEDVDRLYDRMSQKELISSPDSAGDNLQQSGKASVSRSGQTDGDVIDTAAAKDYRFDAGPSISAAEPDVTGVTQAGVVAQIQEQLVRSGLYPGPASGVFDSVTEDAIRSYQSRYDLTPDGRPTEAVLVHMLTHSDPYGGAADNGQSQQTARSSSGVDNSSLTLDAGQLRGDDFEIPQAMGSREE